MTNHMKKVHGTQSQKLHKTMHIGLTSKSICWNSNDAALIQIEKLHNLQFGRNYGAKITQHRIHGAYRMIKSRDIGLRVA